MRFEEAQSELFYALMWHLLDNSVCGQCAMYYAICGAEKATGGTHQPEAPVCSDHHRGCADRARACWKSRPKILPTVAPTGHVPAPAGPQSNAVKPSPGQVGGAAARDTQRGTHEHRNLPISAGPPAGAPGVGRVGKVGPPETGGGPGVRAT